MTLNISLPKTPKIIEQKGNWARFEISECFPGYGLTLGNALRRVLLSSLEGAAITAVKIKGVQHEFSTITHVMEDVIEIILNLKQVRLKSFNPEPVKLSLKAKGEKKVVAGDIKATSDIEIINKDAHIATLTSKKGELEMELVIEQGLGYVPTEQKRGNKLPIGTIAIDAIFSPIKKVNYKVENMRVGDRTDYNKLVFEIETDGTISPQDAFGKATKILVDHFTTLSNIAQKIPPTKEIKEVEKILTIPKKEEIAIVSQAEAKDILKTKIEELKLPKRVINALLANKIKTIESLIKKSEKELAEMPRMGQKAIKEIKKEIGKFGLILKQ